MGLQQEIDARRAEIRSDSYAMSIGELISLYKDGELDIHPEFQRFYRWSAGQKSNLSSEVLREIAYILGLDYKEYETKAKLIDETLLKNRNEVAHGKYLLIDVEQFVELHKTIIDLLDLFSNQISNAASTQAYKRTS